MLTQADALLGRERELSTLAAFLASVKRGSAALALVGEPGIGKTTLFAHVLADARDRGYEIVCARPTSAEQTLSFVGLADLLAGVHTLFEDLPDPQRHALDVALLRQEAGEIEPDPRAIGLGLLAVVRALAASRPLVVAVDDVQWLDGPSAAALSFAFRRLTDVPIGLLVTLRTGADAAAADLVREGRCERVSICPLSTGAIHALLVDRLELAVPRSLLLRIHEACRGNPLFALEIGRALLERGLPEPGRLFEVPADVETLFTARLERLPEETLEALGVAAAAAAPTTALVAAVSGRGAYALEPAVAAGIVRIEGERVHFTHPLLASAVYARLDAGARRELHRRIATAVADREQRARHLALAADAPDRDLAAALDEATGQAARRGATVVAAELAELAVSSTPDRDGVDLRRRRLVAAERHRIAGDAARARGMLEQLLPSLPPGIERAGALLQLAETHTGDLTAMLALREQAVLEARGDDRVLTRALRDLAHTLFVTGEPVRALARAREAVAAADRTGDVRLRALSLAYVAWIEVWNGRVAPDLLERALALERRAGYLRMYESPAIVEAVRRMVQEDDLEDARMRLLAAEEDARDHGDDEARAVLLSHLAELECRAGRFDIAADRAAEAFDLREQLGFQAGAQLYVVAIADALRGRTEAAREAAEQGVALCEEVGYELYVVRNLRVLGLLALSTGDVATAARILTPLPGRLAGRGYGRITILAVLPDSIEALIAVGELEQATEQLEELDETATSLGVASALVRSLRCHALLKAARHEYAAAVETFGDGLEQHELLPDPLERGRTLLALGQTQRRAGRRRDGRESLEQARAVFDDLGARLWRDLAEAELGRLGGRRSSGRTLTRAEEQVAHLVAEGRTNREVAAALFVTERTVETHLSSVYRKLGVRSRSELARRLAGATDRSS